MSPKQYRNLLKRHIDANFNSQKEAADFFGCSPTTMSLVLMLERSPTQGMLDATGHRVRETTKKQYLTKEKNHG